MALGAGGNFNGSQLHIQAADVWFGKITADIKRSVYSGDEIKNPNNFTHVFYNSTCSPYNSFDIICNVLKFPFICEHREIISPIDESTNNWRNVQWTSLTEAHVRWLVVHSCCTHRPLTLTKSCSVCCSEIFFALFEAASENKSHFQERAKKNKQKTTRFVIPSQKFWEMFSHLFFHQHWSAVCFQTAWSLTPLCLTVSLTIWPAGIKALVSIQLRCCLTTLLWLLILRWKYRS